MKLKLISLLTAAAALTQLTACHDPEPKTPTAEAEGFNSIRAMFFNDDRDENSFPGEIDYDNHVITIVVPYTYPAYSDSYLEDADIVEMKLEANFKTGFIIEPPLLKVDLTRDNHFTVTDREGVKTSWIIRGEIRKSAECDILDFSLPDAGVPGIIRNDINQVSLVTPPGVGEQTAEYELSFGATLTPDPRTELIDWDTNPVITCTAQDGVTTREYAFVQEEPRKLPFGLREGSAKIAWAKKQSDYGVTMLTQAQIDAGSLRFNGSAGLGIVGDYLVLNEAGHNKAYVINLKNGNFVKTIDLSAMGANSESGANNHRMASDHAGNLLFAQSRFGNGSDMALWKMKGVDGPLVKLLDYTNYNCMCNTLSVTGDLEGDAIITTNANGGMTSFRWIIRGGELVSNVPEQFFPKGYTGNCWGTMDIVYTTPDPASDYFAIGYIGMSPLPPNASGDKNRTCTMNSGVDNRVLSYGSFCITSNSVENAGDYIEFNNSKYFIHNVMNPLGYGYGTSLVMYDVTDGTLDNQAIDFDGGDLAFRNQYGANMAAATKDKAGNSCDVRFYADPSGFYLYIFFEYCNGYVGCVRADCIDMN